MNNTDLRKLELDLIQSRLREPEFPGQGKWVTPRRQLENIANPETRLFRQLHPLLHIMSEKPYILPEDMRIKYYLMILEFIGKYATAEKHQG